MRAVVDIMAESGVIYISKRVDIYALLEQENEEELLRLVEAGEVRSSLSQRFKRSLESETNPLRAVGILRSTLPASLLDGQQTAGTGAAQPVEVILSEYVAVQQGGE